MVNIHLPDLYELTVQGTQSNHIDFKSLHGKKWLIYFYPKDNTPGCTHESKDFRDLFDEFKKENTLIYGVSRDSISSHQRFKEKHQLPFELIADTDEALCTLFDVIKEKSMFGKKVRGIVRSTFLFNAKGELCQHWAKVKVSGHAQEVLEAVKAMPEA